jgi:branched-subunit amino acid ABC-type transport system permease component
MLQLVLEQALNGLQFGLMLFLLAAGLTLVFGIMDMINLSHGSLYMGGAYLAAAATERSGSFVLGVLGAVAGMIVVGALLERLVLRHFYKRDHLAQVLATFALILISNEIVRIAWGPQPVMLNAPAALSGPVELLGFSYPAYRLLIVAVGITSVGPCSQHRARSCAGAPPLGQSSHLLGETGCLGVDAQRTRRGVGFAARLVGRTGRVGSQHVRARGHR